MNTEKLQEILENHKHWLAEDCDGWETMKAYLFGADLSGADLRGADLSGADLRRANLRLAVLSGANLRDAYLCDADLSGANLRDAYLRDAYLCGANLCDADLRGVELSGADLSGADLRDAYLCGANLRDAYLCGANLCDADLRCVNLSGADLSGADLRLAVLSGADLSGADLRRANLSGVIYDSNTAFFSLVCPEDGSFIGWKKVNGYIVKLRIPEDAKRSSATSRKCRCSHAEVLEIQNRDGSKADIDSVTNEHYIKTTYTVGETVHADKWNENRWNECSHGIHFFITRDEAVNY